MSTRRLPRFWSELAGRDPALQRDLLVEGLAIKTLRTTGESWFTSWRRRQQGFRTASSRLVPEEGNPADPTAVGVWLDDEQSPTSSAMTRSGTQRRWPTLVCNLLVNPAVQTEDGFTLHVQAPAPRALKKLLRTADFSAFASLPAPASIADGFRAGHDARRYPAPAGDYSLPPSVWRPITADAVRAARRQTARGPSPPARCASIRWIRRQHEE